MKKRIGVILLVSLLLASSVFAASVFTGKARLRLGAWNKGDNTWTYGLLDKSDAKVNFIIDELIGNTTGEGKIFAEVKAKAALRVKAGNDVGFMSNWEADKHVQYRLDMQYANIVFNKEKNLKLGISGTWPQPRYAQGWEVEIDNGNTIASDPFFTYSTAFENSPAQKGQIGKGWFPAITLTYDKYALSLSVDGGATSFAGNSAKDPGVIALFQGNGINLTDEMNLSVAVGYMQSSGIKYSVEGLGIGAQRHMLFGLGYKWNSDLIDLALGVNGNVALNDNPWVYEYLTGLVADNEKHGIEASLNFAYKGDFKVNLDAWFLDNLTLWANDNQPDWVTYENRADLGYVYRRYDGSMLHGYADVAYDNDTYGTQSDYTNLVALHKALSLKLALRPVDVLGITLRAQDVLNQGIYAIELPIYITDAITLTPQFEFTSATNKKYKNGSWTLGGATANAIYEGMLGFNYAHDLFNLYASVRVGHETLGTTKDGKVDGSVYVRPYLDITSRALVDNCQLRLRWDSATFGNTTNAPSEKYHSTRTDGSQRIGSIYLEARIDF